MDKFKEVISDYFKEALQVLHAEHIESEVPLKTNEFTNAICWAIEAMFLHGLKSTNVDKNFLGLIKMFSHKSLFEQIRSLKQITTDIGRCRSWIRLALNDTTLEGYMNLIVRDQATIKRWYTSNAFFLDEEQTDIMLKYMQGVSTLKFDLACNASVLNQWAMVPLQLAGVRINANLHWPKSPIKTSSSSHHHRNSKASSSTLVTSSSFQSIPSGMNAESCSSFKLNRSGSLLSDTLSLSDVAFQNLEDSYNASTCSQTSDVSRPDFVDSRFFDYYQTVYDVSANNSDDVSLNDVAMATVAEEEEQEKKFDRIIRENLDKFGFGREADVGEDFDNKSRLYETPKEIVEIESLNFVSIPQCSSNVIGSNKKISDSTNLNQSPLDESFSELLQNYYEPLLATSPMADIDMIFKNFAQSIDDPELDMKSKVGMTHGIDLFNLYTTISREKGLANQSYQCRTCSTSIGMFYGKERICNYDKLYYCSKCLDRAETIIPHKIIYNWDFSNYKVSNESLTQLDKLKHRPLINLQKLNPIIYEHVEELTKIRDLRSRLGSICTYLVTCKHNLISNLETMSESRPYLYQNAHLYSVMDLLKVPSGALHSKLMKLYLFGEKHILSCAVCSQKGFYCELCKSSQVIYPFHVNTVQCDVCKNLFHSTCRDAQRSKRDEDCPRCVRKLRRSVADFKNDCVIVDDVTKGDRDGDDVIRGDATRDDDDDDGCNDGGTVKDDDVMLSSESSNKDDDGGGIIKKNDDDDDDDYGKPARVDSGKKIKKKFEENNLNRTPRAGDEFMNIHKNVNGQIMNIHKSIMEKRDDSSGFNSNKSFYASNKNDKKLDTVDHSIDNGVNINVVSNNLESVMHC